MRYSINDQLILSKYDHGQGLKTNVKSGFATTQQKTNLVSLELLVDAMLNNGNVVKAGSKVYFVEEFLYTDQVAKRVRSGGIVGGEFVVLDLKNAVAIEEKQ